MKRRIQATSTLKARLNENAAKISNMVKDIIRDRLKAAYDLSSDAVALDMYYKCRINVDATTTKGGHVSAYPDTHTKRVNLYVNIPKTEMLVSDPERWAQYIIDQLDKQTGGDVVEFWYSRMTDSRYNPYAPNRNMGETAQVTGSTNMPKKFTKYPKNYVRSASEDVFVWDGESRVPKDVVHVQIADGVTSIDSWAFYKCASLTSITIPNSVTSIGHWAFCGCTSLTSITIPHGVSEIDNYTFCDCRNLTSITIPDSVTRIRTAAFFGCTSLKSVLIPDSVTCIEDTAFADCTSLRSVRIPDSVTYIGSKAFADCTSLRSVRIPRSGIRIRKNAFRGCPFDPSSYSSQLEEEPFDDSYQSLEDWYYSDQGENDSSRFAEELQNLVEHAYPGVTDYFEEPSVQGVQGGDFVTFELNGKRYSYEFDWNDELRSIYEDGPSQAAEAYFATIKEGIETGSAVVEEAGS